MQSFNALLRLTENSVFTAVGAAIATVTTQIKTVNTATYLSAGVFKSKAAADPLWTVAMFQAAVGFANIPIGSRAMFLLLVDGAGTGSVIQGPVALDDAGATVPADTIPEDKTILASVKVVGTSAAFLPGTDNWNKAGVTFTFSDGYDASMVGAYRVNTRV